MGANLPWPPSVSKFFIGYPICTGWKKHHVTFALTSTRYIKIYPSIYKPTSFWGTFPLHPYQDTLGPHCSPPDSPIAQNYATGPNATVNVNPDEWAAFTQIVCCPEWPFMCSCTVTKLLTHPLMHDWNDIIWCKHGWSEASNSSRSTQSQYVATTDRLAVLY